MLVRGRTFLALHNRGARRGRGRAERRERALQDLRLECRAARVGHLPIEDDAVDPGTAGVQPLGKVGRQLDSATAAYNEAIGSFDHRVIPQVRRIEQAGVHSDREVLAPAATELNARTVGSQPAAAIPDQLPRIPDRSEAEQPRPPRASAA